MGEVYASPGDFQLACNRAVKAEMMRYDDDAIQAP